MSRRNNELVYIKLSDTIERKVYYGWLNMGSVVFELIACILNVISYGRKSTKVVN